MFPTIPRSGKERYGRNILTYGFKALEWISPASSGFLPFAFGFGVGSH